VCKIILRHKSPNLSFATSSANPDDGPQVA
jgi:hypothetical protein